MENIDTSKLKRISTYASNNNVTKQTIHNWAAIGKIKIIEIDGFKFVYTEK